MDKKGFEFNFAWLFAILAGAVILFLAIYFASKWVGTSTYQINTITAKQLSIIFEPLETGLASGKSSLAKLNEETRIFNSCEESGSFGLEKISLAVKSFGKYQNPSVPIEIPNKYIFSNKTEQGKTIYFFSKPFEMPWKVSEIIFLSADKYCFVNAPDFVKEEITALNLKNVKFENCSDEIEVCFSKKGCEIEVSGSCIGECDDELGEYSYGFVSKNKENMFFTGSLLYAGIFSDKEIYECNVKRLMKRLGKQALLLNNEINFLGEKCGNPSDFAMLSGIAKSVKNSRDLLAVYNMAKGVEKQNEQAECRLW